MDPFHVHRSRIISGDVDIMFPHQSLHGTLTFHLIVIRVPDIEKQLGVSPRALVRIKSESRQTKEGRVIYRTL